MISLGLNCIVGSVSFITCQEIYRGTFVNASLIYSGLFYKIYYKQDFPSIHNFLVEVAKDDPILNRVLGQMKVTELRSAYDLCKGTQMEFINELKLQDSEIISTLQKQKVNKVDFDLMNTRLLNLENNLSTNSLKLSNNDGLINQALNQCQAHLYLTGAAVVTTFGILWQTGMITALYTYCLALGSAARATGENANAANDILQGIAEEGHLQTHSLVVNQVEAQMIKSAAEASIKHLQHTQKNTTNISFIQAQLDASLKEQTIMKNNILKGDADSCLLKARLKDVFDLIPKDP